MTFSFKKFIKKGEKYIVVENGRPEYVMMHYDDYAELVGRDERAPEEEVAPQSADFLDGFNAEFVLSGPNLPQDISKIRLEDLPL